MIILLIQLVNLLTTALFLLVLTYVIISYFMDPYHPFRIRVDQIVEPLLQPIRRYVPPVGMMDFSPIILLVVVQLLGYVIKQVLFLFL